MATNFIPPEIWFHIAEFIPNNNLRDLLEVNSIFFNLAMNIRYREISIDTGIVLHQLMKTLKRLSDPFITSRVHVFKLTLSVELTDVGEGFSKIGSTDPESGSCIVASTDLIDEIINTTNKLVNVRELYISYQYCPLSYYNLRPLFSSFWSSFGPKLTSLSLIGNLEDYRTLINSNPILDGLQKLLINLESNGAFPVDIFIPFINSLAPHLVSLTLLLWASFDLSVFFSQLASIPGLTTLRVRTRSLALRAQALEGPIRDSSGTLQRVDLRLTSTEPTDGLLGRWFLERISDGHLFSHLRILDIFPTNSTAGVEFLLSCIQRTSESLVELSIRRRILQDREIGVVVDALFLCSNLRYLGMNIRRLDVGLIDLLAFKLPRIDRLRLSIENVSDDANYLADTFVQDLSTRSYTNWKLKDITIYYERDREADSVVMLAFSRSIPSLTSFFSSGHMQLC